MRLLIELKALSSAVYNSFYHKLQGFFYGCLEGRGYEGLHSGKGYKFFSFSNIFPPRDMAEGCKRFLLFSSPIKDLVMGVYDRLRDMEEAGEKVEIGWMEFQIEDISFFNLEVSGEVTLRTGTPIVVRIPKEKYDVYDIVPPKPYDYVYWRKRYSLRAFIKQLEGNLLKKYGVFQGRSSPDLSIFQGLELEKTVANKVVLGGRRVTVIGSLWSFHFRGVSGQRRELLRFGLDSGFGELNSLGFGFMNLEE